MIKVTFLGTSGSMPSKTRNLPSISIEYNGGIYLLDCGEGTQRQMLKYSLNISKIKAIFISHIHGDHVIGIAGLVRTLALNKRQLPLYIFVPKGYENAILQLLTFDKAMISFKIEIRPIVGGTIFKEREFDVSAVKLSHSVPTYGFIFREYDKVHFIEEKAKEAGLKGDMFSDILRKKYLKINNKIIRLKDITYKEKGVKIVYITDTRPVPRINKEIYGADLLIHEATFAKNEGKLAIERKHSTSEEAAMIALKAKVGKLVLMHVSSRYKSTTKILKEAKLIFDNTLIAKDGMVINL
ncbi:MAG: ribonuclease Z [Candidatus Micrarchaeia archaeon]